MKRQRNTLLAILKSSDLDRFLELMPRLSLIPDGLEISLAAAIDLGTKEWRHLSKLRKQGIQLVLRFPRRPLLMTDSALEAWQESERSFPWDRILHAEEESDPFVIKKEIQARYLRASGEHPSRWVRRYGETQIKKVLAHPRLDRFEMLTVAHSGRFEEIESFIRNWTV